MEYEILLSVYFLVIWLNHTRINWKFLFFLNTPADRPGMQLGSSLGLSKGAAIMAAGWDSDKEGSGLWSLWDAPLNPGALPWAHPGSRGASIAQMAAALGRQPERW